MVLPRSFLLYLLFAARQSFWWSHKSSNYVRSLHIIKKVRCKSVLSNCNNHRPDLGMPLCTLYWILAESYNVSSKHLSSKILFCTWCKWTDSTNSRHNKWKPCVWTSNVGRNYRIDGFLSNGVVCKTFLVPLQI